MSNNSVEAISGPERWKTTTSVALILNWYCLRGALRGGEHLILGQKRDTGLWALLGGKLEKGETHTQAIWRELREEADLDQSSVELKPGHSLVITLPHETYTSVGILFSAEFTGKISPDGYTTSNEEIARVKPWSVDELLELIGDQENFYRPEYNFVLVGRWLYDFFLGKYSAFEGEDFGREIANGFGLTEGIFYDQPSP